MSTFTNTAREVEMPNGDVVVIHNAPTGGENTTSNIKKFKYDDNGHVTESTAADAEDLNLSSYSTPTTGTTDIGTSDDIQTAIGKLDHQSHIDQTNILYALNKVGKNLFDFKTWVKSLTGANGGYFTYTDNSITLTATSSAAITIPDINGFHVSVKPSTQYVLAFTGSDTNGAITILKNDTYSGFRTFDTTVGDNVIEITTDSTTTLWSIRFDVNTANQSSTISNVMIIPKEVYDAVGGDFQPYGAPNYDLTRMVNDLQKKAVKVYSFHVNPNVSDPEDAVTYLNDAEGMTPAKMGASSFSYGSWANAWFLPKPCMLKSDGTVDYYLNPNDYSKKADGTASDIGNVNYDGNVMMEFPKIWIKRVTGATAGEYTVSIAPVQVDPDYHCYSNINAANAEVDHFYIAAYNGTIDSKTKMRSISGITLNSTNAPNQTRSQEIASATANNVNADQVAWYTDTWSDVCLVHDLLKLIGKSLDVQRTFGQGITTGEQTAKEAYVTGTLNNKGLFYGDVSDNTKAVKVFGIENFWGLRWRAVAGLINDNGTLKVKMTYGVADGSTAVGYNTTGSGYLNYGSTYGTAGFVKKMQADNAMGYKIIETAGTNETYYCDFYYVNNSQLNYALLGGYSGDGAYCGFCVGLGVRAAYANWDIGGSLSCRPFALPNTDLTRMVNDLQKKAVKVYTYHVNPNESDPEDAVTYLDDATGLTPAKMGVSSFSYGSWANAWFLPRPCMLKSDGTVAYYLNPNDYSKKTDGTASDIADLTFDGNVMLEFPKIWVKRVNDGNGARTVSIAPVNVDGTYKCWSNINAEDKEVDHFYLPAYNGTIDNNAKMRSISGITLSGTVPQTTTYAYAPNYTRAQEVTAATANNPSGKNMWYTETWADMCLIFDLLYLMGKSLNLQGTFGNGLATGSETAMRAYVTGSLNDKGLFYGDISDQATGVKVLGMENLWGCRWHGVAGLINDNGALKVKMTYGVADGSTVVGYNTTGNGYLSYGSTYGTGGYVKKMQADNTMGYKIIEIAGTDATYYCNYYYVINSQLDYAMVGGSAGDGLRCGFYVVVHGVPTHTHWNVGASLSCRP